MNERRAAAGVTERAATDRFRRAFTMSANGMKVVSSEGLVTQVNEAFASKLGFTSAELIGRRLHEITPPQDAAAEQEAAMQLTSGAVRAVRLEKQFFAKDGSLVPALVTVCAIPAPHGGKPEYLGHVEWLTDRRRAEDRLLADAESTVDAIISIDADEKIISWNTGAQRMFGYARREMLGATVATIAPHLFRTARDNVGLADATALLSGAIMDLPAMRRDGSEFPVQLSLTSWDRDGQTYRTVILRDVTAARRTTAVQALMRDAASVSNECDDLPEAMQRLLPAIASSGPFAHVRGWVSAPDVAPTEPPAAVWDADGATPGGSPQAGSPQPTPVDADLDLAWPGRVLIFPGEAGRVILQVPVLVNRVRYGVLEMHGHTTLGADVELHRALTDIGQQLGRVAERAHTASLLSERSFTDPLTGLANRRRALQLLQAAIDAAPGAASVAVMFLDLNRFKVVNDSLGHAAGDDLLRRVASRLGGLLRRHDTLARLGGDEFFVLCTTADGLPVEAVAQRLLNAFDSPFRIHGAPIYLGASIGIVEVTANHEADVLLQHADIAMYRAKRSGHGYAVFDAAMATDVHNTLETQSALHRAVTSRELVVHYQPIIRPMDQTISGLEALVRWERPGHGLVPPGDFIPLAEDSGVIVPIGWYILTEACQQMAAWTRDRPELASAYIAVNVAAAQLTSEFPATVTETLRSTGLPPHQLTLEITEGIMLDDLARISTPLTPLRTLGVKVALDDFGTGYSSLAYLLQLPVDLLKIDRSFIAALGTSARADAVIDVILALAHRLQIGVVAEGVETLHQAQAMQRRNCPSVQGFYYSRPLTADDIGAALDRLSVNPPVAISREPTPV